MVELTNDEHALIGRNVNVRLAQELGQARINAIMLEEHIKALESRPAAPSTEASASTAAKRKARDG